MPSTQAVEKRIDNIKRRDWVIVREEWLAHIPRIAPPGARPALPLKQVPELSSWAAQAAGKKSIRISDGHTSLRASTFWEGTYLLHKACHVIGAAGVHAAEGISTWSLSSFYQGGLFGAKAVLYLMGIGLPEFNGKTTIVDLWPEVSATQRKLAKRIGIAPPESELTYLGQRLDHHSAWYAFLRLVRTARVDVWPNSYISFLRPMRVGDISDQRNAIHYRLADWLFEDLHAEQSILEFFHLKRDDDGTLLLDPSSSDFSLVLAIVVLHMGVLLFESLAELSNALADELSLIHSSLNRTSQLIYRRGVGLSSAWAS
jgi:hypothetical protein